ncbi:hypothetical protein [Legionella parisiensis]|uniref:Uncharacterized protein n=1 Tax=Legionella parisiensis TaxID=45071 RepID=A0A1E5JWG7_9GAMM|nr:hypothetical protein [Legionella parisiensis]OEH48876.1 hypothetical protein lpari_00123 [Legionella parisiensis]STX75898.1 Uncharacterised protein [Legionella parisiensis]
MTHMKLKSLDTPDELHKLPKTKIEVRNFEEDTVMRVTFQPGKDLNVSS